MALDVARQLLIYVQEDEESFVRLVGDLDLNTTDELRRTVQDLLTGRTCDVVLDLSGLEFVDVAGLRLIVWSSTLVSDHDRAMRIVGAHGWLRKFFVLTGADKLVNLNGPQGT